MGPGIMEVVSAVKAQGIGPAGSLFTHHLTIDPATFDFEICVPVSATVASVGRVVPRELPAERQLLTTYQGPYEGLGAAWGEFNNWIAANGYSTKAEFYECYVVGPESGSDPAAWRTELRRPLAD